MAWIALAPKMSTQSSQQADGIAQSNRRFQVPSTFGECTKNLQLDVGEKYLWGKIGGVSSEEVCARCCQGGFFELRPSKYPAHMNCN